MSAAGRAEDSLLLLVLLAFDSWRLILSLVSSFDRVEARGRFLPFLPMEQKASFSSSEDDESLSKPLRGRRFAIVRGRSREVLWYDERAGGKKYSQL